LELLGFIWILIEWSSNLKFKFRFELYACVYRNIGKSLTFSWALNPVLEVLRRSLSFAPNQPTLTTCPLGLPPPHHCYVSMARGPHPPALSSPHFPPPSRDALRGSGGRAVSSVGPHGHRGEDGLHMPRNHIPTAHMPRNPSRRPIKPSRGCLIPASTAARGFFPNPSIRPPPERRGGKGRNGVEEPRRGGGSRSRRRPGRNPIRAPLSGHLGEVFPIPAAASSGRKEEEGRPWRSVRWSFVEDLAPLVSWTCFALPARPLLRPGAVKPGVKGGRL
jgi:hypothetical protein